MELQIRLTQNRVAIIDSLDWDKVKDYSWSAHRASNFVFYAEAKALDGSDKLVKMHHLILAVPKGMECDHKDLNGLNNTRKNLRLATKAQNRMNRKMQTNNKSGYKGVDRIRGRFVARIRFNKHLHHLGTFNTVEEAYAAYCKAGKELFGEFFRAE